MTTPATPEYKRYVMLGWLLIEWKLMYYAPHLVAEKFHDMLTVDDEAYDAYEREYMTLCKVHRFNNTVVHKSHGSGLRMIGEMQAGEKPKDFVPGDGMFEVDFNRPSVQLVLSKYGDKSKLRKVK